MKLPLKGLVVVAGLTLLAAAAVVGQAPSFSPGGLGPQISQFPGAQTGVAPQPGTLGLLAGQEGRLALYCVDLFNDSPTDRDEFRAAPDPRAIAKAGGETMPLHEAIAAGYLSVRGRDRAGDPPRRDGRQWIDLYVRNNTGGPVTLSYPAGYAFVPKGRTPPTLAPGLIRMLETAYSARLTGSDTLAYAMWASRGFTRTDVEQTQLRPIPDTEVKLVQKLLDAGGIEQSFDRERDTYQRLFAEREAALGDEAQTLAGTAALPNGTRVSISGKRGESGAAVVVVRPARTPQPLRYAARVRSLRDGKAEIELLHLKTGRPLQVNGGRLTVRLSAA